VSRSGTILIIEKGKKPKFLEVVTGGWPLRGRVNVEEKGQVTPPGRGGGGGSKRRKSEKTFLWRERKRGVRAVLLPRFQSGDARTERGETRG